MVQLEGMVYYCSEESGGCKMGSFLFEIPLSITNQDGDGASKDNEEQEEISKAIDLEFTL